MAGRSTTARLSPPLAAMLLALVLSGAAAQVPLVRLHVISFSLRADTSHPQIERPFHLIINARFKEPLATLDFVVLPNLAELEDLGDERHKIAGKNGTDFTEIITVVAHHTGKLEVDPAYFNAIDARDGKPKRFSSNDLLLNIEGGPLEDPFSGVRHAVLVVAKMLAILASVLIVASLFFRRRARTVVRASAPVPVVLPVPVPVASPREIVREAVDALRAERSRPSVLRVRKLLWAMSGAGEGETLADVLAKHPQPDPALEVVLRLTERAAFIQNTYLHGAIDEMILAIEQYLR